MNANSPEPPTVLQRSPVAPFVRWSFRLRTPGRLLFAALTLATVVALFYLEERWRGQRAWEKCRAELATKGRGVDLATYVPPKVPDAQNFATTPFLAPLYDFLPGTQTWRDTNAYQEIQRINGSTENLASQWGFDLSGNKGYRWERGRKIDLIVLLGTNQATRSATLATNVPPRPQTQEQAAAIMLSLLKQTYDPVLEELRVASERPYCRFNVNWDYAPAVAILLPHLAIVKGAVRKAAWRAEAELALGKTKEAFDDLSLGLYLSDSVRNEPFLISYLVRIASRAMLTEVIWNGMADHRWSDAQLQRLQAGLEKDDLLGDAQRALQGDRVVFGVRTIDQVIHGQSSLRLDELLEDKRTFRPLEWLMPTGWLYLEMANLCRDYETFISPFDEWRRGSLDTRTFLDEVKEAQNQWDGIPHWKLVIQHRHCSTMLLPAVGKAYTKGLLAQARSDLTRTACALERHYLATGSYPETLEALVPRFVSKVPADIMSGKPLLYRRESPRSYVLYSVGMNLVDDGGVVMPAKGGAVNTDQGDWVWFQRP